MASEDESEDGFCIIIAFLLMVPMTLFRGFVTHKLWGWFITPEFNVQAPSVLVCAGITMTVQVITSIDSIHMSTAKSHQPLGYTIFNALWFVLTLFSGFILHLCM
jgi:hypothetical protein